MSQEKIYPKGIICFYKHPKQPDFVVGSVVITPRELVDWLKENPSLLTDYKGSKQLKLQVLRGGKGLYMTVDTFKASDPHPATISDSTDELPF